MKVLQLICHFLLLLFGWCRSVTAEHAGDIKPVSPLLTGLDARLNAASIERKIYSNGSTFSLMEKTKV